MLLIAGDNVVKEYSIDNSLRFNDNDSAYLSRTPASAGNRKTWVFDAWIKRANLGSTQYLLCCQPASTSGTQIYFDSSDRLAFFSRTTGTTNGYKLTSAVFRDVASFYHIHVEIDTTNGTAADRIIIEVNGERITAFDSSTDFGLNDDTYINTTNAHDLGRNTNTGGSPTQYFDGYMAEPKLVDGTAPDVANFGEFGDYGEWKPIAYTGTYGTNGFYLDFEASGDLGNDVSGNGNDWTPTNLAATDQMLDTPTNNFATVNVLAPHYQTFTLQEGNLEFVTSGTYWSGKPSSFGADSGKWYCEYTLSGTVVRCGVSPLTDRFDDGLNPQDNAGCIQYYTNGNKYVSGSASAYGASYTTGDVIGIALDKDADTVTFYKNGVSQGSISLTSEHSAGTQFAFYSAGSTVNVNFGQDSSFAGNKTAQGNTDDNGKGDFYYSPPSGFLSLCSQNLPEATVVPSEHFNTVLYTGTGATQSITGVGFATDWTWVKKQSGNASLENHWMSDSVRGDTKHLSSNLTDAEYTFAGSIASLDSDGFTLGVNGNVNRLNDLFVSWNWKANGAGVSNTDGSITSTVSANVDAGFSIVSYTGNGTGGATVGHGLSKKPELILTKGLTAATNWVSYSEEITANKYLLLNLTSAELTSAGAFNNTEPTASVFSVGTFGDINGNGTNFIAYAFHSVDGFSKFGSYTGNGSTDGPFVYCGFRPAYVLTKRTDAAGQWYLEDDARNGDNPGAYILYPNTSGAEYANATEEYVDYLANGFKIRNSGTGNNANGGAYIFMAFAENPFKNTNAR